MNESQEVALVSLCKAGDKDAFRVLIELHRGVLFGTAYLMTRDRTIAEDAVQETLIKTWKHLPSLRLQSNVKAWLVRIVVNEVKQQFRKKKVTMISLEEAPDVVGDPEETETVAIRREEHKSLRRALEILPLEQREVIVLRYFSELTVPEIAAVMGKREGTIKSRLSRALDRLGEIIRDEKMWEVRR